MDDRGSEMAEQSGGMSASAHLVAEPEHHAPTPAPARAPAREDLSRHPEDESAGASIDHFLHAWQSQFTGGLSPTALALAWWDWALHLGNAPGKQMELAQAAMHGASRLLQHALAPGGEASNALLDVDPDDHRFRSPSWQRAPHSLAVGGFLAAEHWLRLATTGVPGIRQRHERLVSFLARQSLDAMSPANFAFSNPDVLQQTVRAGGWNFARGAMNLWADLQRPWKGDAPTAPYEIGVDIAATPGRVVFRNHLMELIQYAPATPRVAAEPVLLVPAWIMKYYILDLSAANSLVRYLVERGFTVFAISWRNPAPEDRDIGLEDYREQGVMAALEAIGAILPERRVHAAGYCLGGTLLAIAAAEMARAEDDRLASITLLTTQLDFTEAGGLLTFISEDQVAFLEDEMWVRGYLDASHMAGAFQVLRANDLIWAQAVRRYLLGEEDAGTDLMAWNRDTTRMPYRMQAEYLRQMFLGNDLARGRYLVEGRPVSLGDIRAPIFAVATERDHVAPWRSVYKMMLLTSCDLTLILTGGGHNGGVVSEPGHPGRAYRLHRREAGAPSLDLPTWEKIAERRKGSWWEAWLPWLESRGSGERADPPALGAAERGYPVLDAAPGTYVLMR